MVHVASLTAPQLAQHASAHHSASLTAPQLAQLLTLLRDTRVDELRTAHAAYCARAPLGVVCMRSVHLRLLAMARESLDLETLVGPARPHASAHHGAESLVVPARPDAPASTPPPRTRSSPSHALMPTISSAEIADEIVAPRISSAEIADEIVAPRGDLVYYLADEIAPPLLVEVEEARPPTTAPPLPPSSLLCSISHMLLKIPLHGDEDADDEFSCLLAAHHDAAAPDEPMGALEYLEEEAHANAHHGARAPPDAEGSGAQALGAPVEVAHAKAHHGAQALGAPVEVAHANADPHQGARALGAPVPRAPGPPAPSVTAPVTALCNLLRRMEPRGAESGDALLPWLQAELAIAAAMGGEGIAQQAQLEAVMHVLEPIIKEPTATPRPPPLIAATIKEPTATPRPPPLIAAIIKEPTDMGAAPSSSPPTDERTTAVDAVSSATTSPVITAVNAVSSAAGFVVIPVMGRVFGAPSASGDIWSDESAAEVPGDYGGGGGGASCSTGNSSPAAADHKGTLESPFGKGAVLSTGMRHKGTLESPFGAMAPCRAKAVHGKCSVQRADERPEPERALLGAVLGEIRAKRAALLQRARKREACALAVAELVAAKSRATRHCGLLNHEWNTKRLCRVAASEEMRAPLTKFQRQGGAPCWAGNSSGAAAERLANAAAVLETLTMLLVHTPNLPKKEAIEGLQRLLWRLAYVAARSATARNQQDVALLEACARLRQDSAQHGAAHRPPASLGVPVEHERCVELMGLIQRQLKRLQEESTIEAKAQLVTECWRLIFLGARPDARPTRLRLPNMEAGEQLPNTGMRPATAGGLSDESGAAARNPHATSASFHIRQALKPHATSASSGGSGRREEMSPSIFGRREEMSPSILGSGRREEMSPAASAAPGAAARWVVDRVSSIELDEASMADLLPTAAWTLIHATSSTLLSDLQLILEMLPPALQKAPTAPLMAADGR